MYDLAKRSLAFTVATGGLLLTGTAYTPALAAAGVGANQGPAQAQGVQSDANASASSVTAAGSSGAGEGRAVQAPPDLLAPSALHPNIPAPKPRAASGPGAAASSNTNSSGGLVSGNNIQIPVNIGLDLCGDDVRAGAVRDTAGGGHCSSQSGAGATATTSHSGGIGSGNSVQVPVNVPILACDNTVAGAAAHNTLGGANCGSPSGSGGAAASQTTDHSGGILSGNIVQAPVNVPINACGNTVNAAVVSNTESGASCTNSAEGSAPTMPGAPAPGSGGASATAASVDNGGIGSGMAVQTPINVPLNVCGITANAAAAHDAIGGGVCADNGGSATAVLGSNGNGGVVSGNSVQTPIEVPANVCGVEALGATSHVYVQNPTCTSSSTGGTTPPGSTAITVSSNNGGIGSGNSAQTPINVPVNACGANVTAAGMNSSQTGPECTTSGTRTTVVNVGGNNGGVGSGNTVPVPVNVPVTVCGDDVEAVKGPSGGVDCSNVPHMPPTKPCPPTRHPTPPPTKPCPPTRHPTPPPTKPCPPTRHPTPPPTKPCPPTRHPTPPPTTPPTTPPMTPPSTPSMPPPHHAGPPPHNGGGLAHTGADIGIALGVAGAALIGGLGLRAAARRREGE